MIYNILKQYSTRSKTPLQLNYLYLYKFNNNSELIAQSNFLKHELCTRISHRIYNLIKLPYGLPMVPEIKTVLELYINSFERIYSHPKIICENSIISFTNELENIKNNHNNIEFLIARGLQRLESPLIDYNIINKELNHFFMSRIGIRTLTSQHISCVKYQKNIFTNCNLNKIIHDAVDDISFLGNYLDNISSPEIVIDCCESISLPYLDSHIFYIMIEILKNSIVAHNKYCIEDQIKIKVREGEKYINIQISDKGNGFRIELLNKIMSYSYSTNKMNTFKSDTNKDHILSGYGFGLPMTKLYINYFGGIFQINPMENIGTDVYIYLNKKGSCIEEL